jgi:hypothetical protein
MKVPVTAITTPMRVKIASLDHVDETELDMVGKVLVGEANGGRVGAAVARATTLYAKQATRKYDTDLCIT